MRPGMMALAELTSKVKEQFVKESMDYILHLAKSCQSNAQMTTKIVRGLASFDPRVLFSLKMETASRFLAELFYCFRLEKWLSAGDLTLYRDE